MPGQHDQAIHTARRLIQLFGFTVIASSTTDYDFAYTVGLVNNHQPELIITGMPPQLALPLLDATVRRVQADDQARVGSTYEIPNHSNILPTLALQLAPVSGHRIRAHFTVARTILGHDQIKAWQVMWHDFNRRHPTHPLYDHAALSQPLLHP